MDSNIANKKLAAARNLLGKKMALPALGLILEVAKQAPDYIDPTLKATIPLWEIVFKELMKEEE